MFKFFRFKTKEEFDASVDDLIPKIVEETEKQFSWRITELIRYQVYKEVSGRDYRLDNRIDGKIKDLDTGLSNLISEVDSLKIKVETVLNLLRVNK
jgi:septation ring formation regulator EzrA